MVKNKEVLNKKKIIKIKDTLPLLEIKEYQVFMNSTQYVVIKKGSSLTRYFSCLDMVVDFLLEEEVFERFKGEERISLQEAAEIIKSFRPLVRKTAEDVLGPYITYVNYRRGSTKTPWGEPTGDEFK